MNSGTVRMYRHGQRAAVKGWSCKGEHKQFKASRLQSEGSRNATREQSQLWKCQRKRDMMNNN